MISVTLQPKFSDYKEYMKENSLEEYLVLEWRDEFIDDHGKEVYDDTVTLCHRHHLQLHSIYGQIGFGTKT